MRLSLSVLISICCLGVLFSLHLYSQTTPIISMDTIYTTNYNIGDTLYMPVRAKNFTDVGSIGLWINFHSDVVSFYSLSNINPLISSISYNCIDTILKAGWFDTGNKGINLPNTVLFNIKFIYIGGSGNTGYDLTMSHLATFTSRKYINATFINGFIGRKPFSFNLLAPANNSVINYTPAFSWSSSRLALIYKLIIDGKLIKDSVLSSAYKFPDSVKLSPGLHRWYIIASNKSDSTISNQTWSFFIDYTPPANFSLVSPLNNSTPVPCNTLFNWQHSFDNESGLSGYQLNIVNYPSQSVFTTVNISPQDTFYTGPAFMPVGAYYWYVKAFNNAGSVTISNTDTFSILPQKIDSVSGKVTYDNAQHSSLRNVKVILSSSAGTVLDSAFTDSTGSYVFKNLDNGNYIIDASVNFKAGGINPVDALLTNRCYLKLYNFPDNLKQSAADVNADSKINPIDALLINRYYLKLVAAFEAGKWLFEKPSFTISCDKPVVNIKGICFGDVNGSYLPK